MCGPTRAVFIMLRYDAISVGSGRRAAAGRPLIVEIWPIVFNILGSNFLITLNLKAIRVRRASCKLSLVIKIGNGERGRPGADPGF